MQKNNASYFDGRLIQLIGWKILLALVIFFTLGLAYPWAVCKLFEWEASIQL
jgi:uncharacterized membrane protein YjgN (DUF898 family)